MVNKTLFKYTLIIIISLFILTIISPNIQAATPNILISDTLNTTLGEGNYDIGTILIVQTGWTPINHNHSQLETITIGQYDLLRWNGNFSISIADSIVSPGGAYQAVNNGTFIITNLQDNSQTSILNVIPVSEISVNISHEGLEELYYDEQYILEQELEIPITTEIVGDKKSGSYETTFNIKINNNTYFLNKTFIMPEIKGFRLENISINTTLNTSLGTGENQILRNITFHNDGNTITTVNILKTGNTSDLLFLPSGFSILPGIPYTLPIVLQVPFGYSFDEYTGSIQFTGTKNDTGLPVRISIIDKTTPNITSINFEHSYLIKNNIIILKATDNNKINNVTISYNGKTYGMISNASNYYYNGSFNTTIIDFEFCAYDEHNNNYCTTIQREFEKYNLIIANTSIQLPSTKKNVYSSKHIFSMDEGKDPVGVWISNLVTSNPTEMNIRIVSPDGSITELNTNMSENISMTHFSQKGDYTIEVLSSELATFDGILNFQTPSYSNTINSINFKGRILDYNVPEPFVRENFCGNYNLEMLVEDTGVFDDSYVEFYYKCPINLAPSEQPVLVSQEYLTIRDEQMNTTINGYLKQRNQMSVAFASSISLVLIMGLIVLYSGIIYPRFRFKKVIR